MVMQWTPREPEGSNDVCGGVVAYADSRPYPAPAYVAISWVVFGVINGLLVVGMFGKHYYRNDPRFYVIRPIFMSWLPCAVFLVFMLLGIAGLGVGFALRILNYAIQSQFEVISFRFRMRVNTTTQHAPNQGDEHEVTEDDDVETEEPQEPLVLGHQSSIMQMFQPNHWHGKTCICTALISIIEVVLGCKDLDSLTFEELVLARRSRMVLIGVVLSPSLIVLFVILIAIPQYRYCTGCAFFIEPMIALFVAMAPYILIVLRILFIVRREKFPDRQGIIFEYMGIMVLVVPVTMAWMVLIIIDPGNGEFNRIIAYEWFGVGAVALYWWFTTGIHIVKAFQQRRQLYQAREWWARNQQRISAVRSSPSFSSSSAGHPQASTQSGSKSKKPQPQYGGDGRNSTIIVPEDFLDIMDRDNGLKEEFTQFAISRYAVENFHFVNDARAFHLFFDEKAPSWRKQKAIFLYRTYVELGSPMEVNISDATRQAITHHIQTNIAKNDLENVFDAAVQDITCNVLRQMWLEFQHERRDKKKARRRESSSPAVSIGRSLDRRRS